MEWGYEVTEKQEYVIKRLNDIADISQELMNIAITGDDGNLEEMSYHIKCYTKKIIIHLLKEWENNIKFAVRRNEKKKIKEEQKRQEQQEMQRLNKQIFKKFVK